MNDLRSLLDGEFECSPRAPCRLALVHHSFRAVSTSEGVERQRFAAHFPALGLLNLAHSLRVAAARGLLTLPEIRYFDQEAYASDDALHDALHVWLSGSPRPILAATAYTSTFAHLESSLARFDPTRVLIVLGGPHVSLAPDIEQAHIVVRGEGGLVLRHIIDKFYTPEFGSGPEARGLLFRLDGEETKQPVAFDQSLAELPSPGFAFDLLPRDEHAPVYATNFTRMLGVRPQVYVCTQSCRARCTFCSTYLIHGKTVARPIRKIEEDLEHIVHELGHDSLEFHDDDLFQHPELHDLLEVLRQLGIPWFCYGRVDPLEESLARRLARAGCRRIFLGVESMDQRTLDYFRKETTVEQNRSAIEVLARNGIGPIAGFLIGAPHHTVESILADLDAYLSLPLMGINCTILSPDPGTVEFRRARSRQPQLKAALGGAHGRRLIPDPARYGSQSPFGLPSVCDHVDKATLNELQLLIDASFYLRSNIWKGLTAGRNPTQVETVRMYYDHLLAELNRLRPGHPELSARAESLRKQAASAPQAFVA